MKISYVINGTGFGGSERMLVRRVLQMRKRGHHAYVVSLKPLGPLGRELQECGFSVLSLGMGKTVGPGQLVLGTVRLTKVFRSLPCDIVHSFLPRANLMSRIANRMAKAAPHVSSEESLNLARSVWITRANRMTLRWTNCVLAVSPPVRDQLLTRERVPAGKLRVIVNGIDVREVDQITPFDIRGELRIGERDRLLCSIGRLHPVKGHIFLVRALGLLKKNIRNIRLVLVGNGPEAQRLRREAEVLGVADRVHFLGFRRDAVAVMKACDIVALPSLEEGLPVTALEAMAARLPIVGSAVGGLLHAVQPSATGILVPVGDVSALAAALETLLLNPALARCYGEKGRCVAHESFSLDRLVSETEQLYRELAA